MNLAVLFPGLGYTCDKPLMYYSGKLAMSRGYELICVRYGNFPKKVLGDAERLRESIESAQAQAAEILKDVNFGDCEDILLIGKSIGTLVACRYAKERGLEARTILYTPLVQTFDYVGRHAIAFHGTADPWADTAAICAACGRLGVPLDLTVGANHSLETGHVDRDLQTLSRVMALTAAYMDAPCYDQ